MSTQNGGVGYAASEIANAPRFARAQMTATPEQRRRIRANASLPKQAWVGIEDAVYPAMDDQLTVVTDLREAGLTISESIYNKVAEWHKRDYEATATISMEPETATDEGDIEYDLDGSPIPLIHSDFSVGFRDSGSEGSPPGNMAGEGLETLNAEGSARAVAEAMEELVLYGWEPSIGGDDLGGVQDGYTMYGLANHPSAHEGELTNWTADDAEDFEHVRQDIKDKMARDLKDDNFRATNQGYWLYVGEGLEDVLDEYEREYQDHTVRESIERLSGIGKVEVSQFLEDDAALLFRPTADVVDLAFALEEQVVQWEDPFRDYFKTVTAFTPRVKDTLRGQCGIAYYTGGTEGSA